MADFRGFFGIDRGLESFEQLNEAYDIGTRDSFYDSSLFSSFDISALALTPDVFTPIEFPALTDIGAPEAVGPSTTNLEAGSLALLGFNSGILSDFSFVLLTAVEAGTEIYFTDAGFFNGSTSPGGNEGLVRWTASVNYAAGSVINSVENSEFDFAALSVNPLLTSAFNLDAAGDQIFAFQTEGEDLGMLNLGDLRFLFGLQSNSNVFQGSGDGQSGDITDSNQSGVPEGLIEGLTALARGSGPGDEDAFANIVYTGPTTGTRAALQAAIADPANWTGSATALTQATLDFTVTDAAANSVPVLTVPMGVLMTAEDTPIDLTTISVADADGDALTITLDATSTVTVVDTGTAIITNNGTDSVTISGSVAEVNAALATVTYLPTQDFNGTGTLRIAAFDGSGAFDAFILDITVTAVNDAPLLTNIDANVGFTAAQMMAGPQILFADPDVTDVDSANLDTGVLTVSYASGATIDDQLSVFSSTLPEQIEIDGTNVNFLMGDAAIPPNTSPILIGTITSDGSNGTDLIITFNSQATPDRVDLVVNALQYQNTNAAPSGTRDITVTLTDGDGATSLTSTTTITITSPNAGPTLSDLESTLLLDAADVLAGPQNVDTDVTLVDADSADFDGGNLTITYTAGLPALAADQLSFLNCIMPPGTGIEIFGMDVFFDSNQIGVITSDGTNGTDLVVDFSGVFATPAAVEALIEALQFQDTSAAPGGQRELSITVNDGDGGTSVAQTIAINIAAPPPPPSSDLIYTEGDGIVAIDANDTIVVGDPAPNDFTSGSLTVSITSGAIAAEDELSLLNIDGVFVQNFGTSLQVTVDGAFVGEITGGGVGGGDLVITFPSSIVPGGATTEQVQRIIDAIAYSNSNIDDPIDGDRDISFTLVDSGAVTTNLGTITVDVEPVEDAPVLSDLAGMVSYDAAVVNAAPQDIDTDVTVADLDTVDFDGGSVSIGNTTGGLAEDQLSVRDSGTPGTGIEVSGMTVSFNGNVIGTISSDGSNGSDLVVDLTTTDATTAAVEALIEAFQYQNTAASPTNLRTLRVDITDGEGGVSSGNPITVEVTGAAVNTAPTITDVAANVVFDEDTLQAAPQLIDMDVTVADIDSADFDGGTLTLAYTAPPVLPVNNLSVRDSGTPGTGIEVSGTAVSFNGVQIGTITDDGMGGNNLVIALSGMAATAAAVEALIEAFQYQNTSTTPEPQVDVTLQLSDGDGESTALIPIALQIVASDDPSVAQDDIILPVLDENATSIALNLFADNGNGVDFDEDSAFSITDVEGGGTGIINLASGAIVTVIDASTGDVVYDLNGAFASLPALGSGASNATVTETFVYTITGGDTATVTLTINGIDSDDFALGTAGDDNINSGIGNDTIDAGDGDDVLDGGSGRDIFIGGEGNDTHIGGTGLDTIDYSGAGSAVELDVMTGGTVGDAAGDSYTSVEVFIGSDFDDVMNGSGTNNIFFGGSGADTLNGNAGNDRLFGEAGDDVLSGGDGNDIHSGGLGRDTFIGGAGNDHHLGGLGLDTLDYSGSTSAVEFDVGTGGTVGDAAGDTYALVELFIGSDFNDVMNGDAQNNIFFGGDGGDILNGNGGNDRLFGELGNDILAGGDGDDIHSGGAGDDRFLGGSGADYHLGGSGFDTVDYIGSTSAVTVNLATGGTVGDAAGDTYLLIESVFGSQFGDDITGSANRDVLIGFFGNDMLTGSGGADAFVYFQGFDGADTITDFDVSNEIIVMQNALMAFDSFAEIIGAAMDDGTDTTIDFGSGNTLTLQGVLVGELSAANFFFPLPPPATIGESGMEDFASHIQSEELLAFLAQPAAEPAIDNSFAEDMFEFASNGEFDAILF